MFCTFGPVSMINALFSIPLPSDPKSEIHFCYYWDNYTIVLSMVFVLTPTSVKNTHEKASQSTPPCLFGELLSSSVNNAGMTWIGKAEFTFYLFLWRMVGLSRCFKNLNSWNYLHELCDKTLRLKKMNIFSNSSFHILKYFIFCLIYLSWLDQQVGPP